jgi:hypothetical protein
MNWWHWQGSVSVPQSSIGTYVGCVHRLHAQVLRYDDVGTAVGDEDACELDG